MEKKSNGDKLRELYQKAASTSLLLNLTEEEIYSLIVFKKPETPTSSEGYPWQR